MHGAAFNVLAFLPLVVLAAAASPPNQGDTSLAAVRYTFDEFNVPADTHFTFNPSVLLEVTFPDPGAAPVNVKAGEQVPKNVTAGTPSFGLRFPDFGLTSILEEPFVIASVDLDGPTPQAPTLAQVRHFLGGSFFLGVEHQGVYPLMNSTPAVTDWFGAQPPAGSDPHRYVFFVFRESRRFAHQHIVDASTPIVNFNLSAFAHATGLGDPIGGTFMFVGPDSSST
ncbi:PEBP-like protein [Gloeopeniophorella convolvens]|nr:PEBP-like protein [Gloeopeniophorella convolvens]